MFWLRVTAVFLPELIAVLAFWVAPDRKGKEKECRQNLVRAMRACGVRQFDNEVVSREARTMAVSFGTDALAKRVQAASFSSLAGVVAILGFRAEWVALGWAMLAWFVLLVLTLERVISRLHGSADRRVVDRRLQQYFCTYIAFQLIVKGVVVIRGQL